MQTNHKLVYQETDFECRLVNSHQNQGRRKFENCESSVKLSCIGMLLGKVISNQTQVILLHRLCTGIFYQFPVSCNLLKFLIKFINVGLCKYL